MREGLLEETADKMAETYKEMQDGGLEGISTGQRKAYARIVDLSEAIVSFDTFDFDDEDVDEDPHGKNPEMD